MGYDASNALGYEQKSEQERDELGRFASSAGAASSDAVEASGGAAVSRQADSATKEALRARGDTKDQMAAHHKAREAHFHASNLVGGGDAKLAHRVAMKKHDAVREKLKQQHIKELRQQGAN